MADESDLEKTEQPTESKITKAKEKGQIPRSRELSSMIMLFVAIGVLWMYAPRLGSKLVSLMQQGMIVAAQTTDDVNMLISLIELLKAGFWIVFPIMAAMVIAALFTPMLIGGLLFSTQSLKPDLKRMNPISGFKRMFGTKIFAELVKCILKVVLITLAAGWFLLSSFSDILSLPNMFLNGALSHSMQMMIYCGLLVVISLMPMVTFDVFYQLWSHIKKLKMSKQEIKDEFKEHEGDPHVKARIRQIQRSMSRRKMMSDVPKADVIITNPTHYAIALQYDDKTMSAPKVLAKGTDLIALRIKEIGNEHNIPQLESPPLARALYRHSEIGKTIPTEFYAAIAQVLAWVYQLKHWKRKGGAKPITPTDIPVPEELDKETSKGSN